MNHRHYNNHHHHHHRVRYHQRVCNQRLISEKLHYCTKNEEIEKKEDQKLSNRTAIDILTNISLITNNPSYSDLFNQLNASTNMSVIEKWQLLVSHINQLIDNLLINEYSEIVKPPSHLSPSSYFQLLLFDLMANDKSKEVITKYQNNWSDWMMRVFNFDSQKDAVKFDVSRARLLVSDLIDSLIAPDYLDKLSTILQDEKLTEEERSKQFIEILTPQHMNVIEQYGFEGDLGYLQCQKIITCDYPHDQQIRKLCDTASRLSVVV